MEVARRLAAARRGGWGMSEGWSGFWCGVFVGLILMGALETCIPGIGYHDAMKSKIACEKSLPRDQNCVPNYVPSEVRNDH